MRSIARLLGSALIILALLGAGTAVGCSPAQTSSSTTSQPESASAKPSSSSGDKGGAEEVASPALDFDLEQATVTRVVDGDTTVMTLGGGASERVRFIGVDTPESTTEHEPYGEEASAYTKSRLSGKTVWLQVGTEARDRYGRLLAYVWLQPPADTSEAELRAKQFNAQLLLEGYAQILTIPPNVDYVDQYRAFQTEAREANRGLWALPASESAAPAPAPAPPPSAAEGGGSGGSSAAYIGNRNSMKFHFASCTYVGQMNPENKVPFATREEAIAAAYVPCKVCKP